MASVHSIHFCLRPDTDGVWHVQNDADHAHSGVDMVTGVIHDVDHLRVYFSPVYDKAGSAQITTDDDFAGSIVANAGLGRQCVAIKIRVHPNVRGIEPSIDPKRIWEYLHDHPRDGGNLWVNVTMVND